MLKSFLITTFLSSAVYCNSLNAITITNDTDDEVRVQAYIQSKNPENNKIYFLTRGVSIAPKSNFTITSDMLNNYTPGTPMYVTLNEFETKFDMPFPVEGKQEVDNYKIDSLDEFNHKTFRVTTSGISQ